jgi:hypothetical protein
MADLDGDQRHLDCVRAVFGELQRVAEKDRREWTCPSHLPVVPHAAQLSTFCLLLLKALPMSPVEQSADRDKLTTLLTAALRKAEAVWADALSKKSDKARDRLLDDREAIRSVVMRVVRFADRQMGRGPIPLSAFIDSVQDALADLTARCTALVEKKLAGGITDGSGSDVPSAVYGALAVTSVAGGMVGRRVMSDRETSAVRVAVKLAAKKDETEKAEPESAKRIRRTLKKLGPHLPEERA